MACRRRLRCSRADTFFIPCPPPLEVAPSVPGTEESSPTADGAGDTLELDEVAVVVVVAAVLVTGEVFFTGGSCSGLLLRVDLVGTAASFLMVTDEIFLEDGSQEPFAVAVAIVVGFVGVVTLVKRCS